MTSGKMEEKWSTYTQKCSRWPIIHSCGKVGPGDKGPWTKHIQNLPKTYKKTHKKLLAELAGWKNGNLGTGRH